MNKVELISAVAKHADLSKKDAEEAVKCVFDSISAALEKGDKVQIMGFGTFETTDRAAREGRNPRTGEAMEIRASRSVHFKAGKGLKDRVK